MNRSLPYLSVATLLVLGGILLPYSTRRASCQNDDESVCAAALKPDTETIRANRNAEFIYLHTITRTTYEEFKKGYGGKLDITIPIEGVPIPFGLGANYDEFSMNRSALDEKTKTHYTQNQAFESIKTITPEAGIRAWLECIRLHHPVIPDKKGLVVTLKPQSDPHLVLAEVFWNPFPGAPPEPPVTDFVVFISGKRLKKTLLPVGTKLSPNSSKPIAIERPVGASVSVIVEVQGASDHAEIGKDTSGLFSAIKHGNVDLVKDYLNNGISPDQMDDYGDSAFYFAAAQGETEIVKAMLPYHPDVNFVWSPNDSAYTPLIAAAISGHTETVKALLSIPTLKKDTQDKGGQTALHKACRDDRGYAGNPATVKALVDGGITQSITDQYGWTARGHVKNEIKPPFRAAEMLVYLAPQKDAP